MQSPVQWSESRRKTLCVLGSSTAALPVSLGTVYCADRFIPRQMDWLKTRVAEYIVEPHIELFDKITKNLRKAHNRYDEKKQALLAEQGKPVPPKAPDEDLHQKAKDIAGKMITFATALTADVAASIVVQQKLNKLLDVCTNPCRTCFTEGLVQMGVTAMMPTLFARASENIHFGISKTIRKVTDADRKVADDIGISTTYVAFPGLIAAAAALVSGHNGHSAQR